MIYLPFHVYTVNDTLVAMFAEKTDALQWIKTRTYPLDYYLEIKFL